MRPSNARNDGGSLERAGSIRKRRMALLFSYAPDWILTIGLTVAFWTLDLISGFKREFDLNDTSIQHTMALHERVPNWLLAVLVLCPLVLMPVVNAITIRSWWDWHNSSLGLILALALTGSVTNIIKVTTGRPRPDLIDRCQPLPGSENSPIYGLVNSSICTQTDSYTLKDGFRSFPSGHSSLSAAGLGFLSFYLAGKLHLWDERGHTGKAWLSLAPLVGAILIAITRTMDYRHHWHDVLIGSLLGFTLAFFAYRQYFPALSHPLSHRPYAPRIPGLRPPSSRAPSRTDARPDEAPQEAAEDAEAVGGTVPRQGKPLGEVWREGASENLEMEKEGDVVPRDISAGHAPTGDTRQVV